MCRTSYLSPFKGVVAFVLDTYDSYALLFSILHSLFFSLFIHLFTVLAATCLFPRKAMAQSVRGLRQSAALCGHEELPLTMDLLQGSEVVAAVLSRYVLLFPPAEISTSTFDRTKHTS